MLTRLSIRDVVLIEALDLDFTGGLGVLTGETGAGKSILLDALGLALGTRADSGLVRAGQAQAVVSVAFDLPPGHRALRLLDEQGLAPDVGEPLVVRRIVKADGGSRGFVGGGAASAGLLRELGAALVEIHGQHDDRGLLNPRGHRSLLDQFGGVDIGPVSAAWTRLSAAREALHEARASLDEAQRDRDWLEHAVAELTALAPEPGEEDTLSAARTAMQQGARLKDDLAAVDALLEGSNGALTQLRQASRRLDRMAGDHPLLAEALAAMDRAVIESAEAEDKIAQAAEALSFSPERLEDTETRLFELRAMARKHRVQPDDLAGLADELAARLEALDAGEGGLAALDAALAAAQADYAREADAVSAVRRAAALRLDAAVAGELAPLKLDAARFRTVVDDGEPGPSGRDRVAFEVSTNPGAPWGPLTKIASGGELSRFILALKVALAEAGGAGTMIFDEIDRGVGGAVASAIGDRLHRLAEGSQVLVVTHSPQVAARAARHFLIAKSHTGTVTRTGVHSLDEAERQEEIARMLSGARVTDEARAQAVKLLEAA
jgi:DNA repair protein RecN (Recombination protein N)